MAYLVNDFKVKMRHKNMHPRSFKLNLYCPHLPFVHVYNQCRLQAIQEYFQHCLYHKRHAQDNGKEDNLQTNSNNLNRCQKEK